MTTRIFLDKTDNEFDFDPSGTSAVAWNVYPTIKGAMRAAAHPAHSPSLFRFRGGYITVPSGHPVPRSAKFIASREQSGWVYSREIREAARRYDQTPAEIAAAM